MEAKFFKDQFFVNKHRNDLVDELKQKNVISKEEFDKKNIN